MHYSAILKMCVPNFYSTHIIVEWSSILSIYDDDAIMMMRAHCSIITLPSSRWHWMSWMTTMRSHDCRLPTVGLDPMSGWWKTATLVYNDYALLLFHCIVIAVALVG